MGSRLICNKKGYQASGILMDSPFMQEKVKGLSMLAVHDLMKKKQRDRNNSLKGCPAGLIPQSPLSTTIWNIK